MLAPTHSSNLDSFVLGLSLSSAGLPAFLYAAGKHLFRHRGLGFLMRRLGGYCVDRGQSGPLYRDVLKEYSTVLLERGFHTIIFPGATRCRSNEVERSVKLGLLGTVLHARRNASRPGASIRPIHVVPVTINYNIVVEAEILIHYYLAGRAEERIFGDKLDAGRLEKLVARWAALDEEVAIRFGDPIESPESAEPMTGSADSADEIERQQTRELGAALTRAFRRHTVFFATHVTSRALYELATARAHTTDIHELLELAPGSLAFPADQVHAAIARFVAVVRSSTGHGVLHDRVADMSSQAIAARALQAWRAGHGVDVVARADGRYVIGDLRLLYFYRNRTSHVDFQGGLEDGLEGDRDGSGGPAASRL